MNKPERSTVTLAALIIANLIPVFGVLQLDWDVGAIVVLYWCENLVIGFYTLIKLFMAGGLHALPRALFFTSLWITGAMFAIVGIILAATPHMASRSPDVPRPQAPVTRLFPR